MISRPPTSPDAEVKTLALAFEYADIAIASKTKVVYYLGPGIYLDTGYKTFTHSVELISYNYGNNQLLTDGVGGGYVPFLGTTNNGRGPGNTGKSALTSSTLEAHIKNADNHPVFLTITKHEPRNVGSQNAIAFRPLTLRFLKDAIVQGVVWWGATTTLEQLQGTATLTNQLVPNSMFSQLNAAQLQIVTTQTDRDQVLNSFIYQVIAAQSSTNNVDYLRSTPCMVAHGTLRTRDVAITATALPYFNIGTNSDQPVIELRDNGVLRLNGTYFIGNNAFNSLGFASQGSVPDITFKGESAFNHFGFARHLISMNENSANGVGTLQFCGWGSPIKVGASNYVWNTTYMNIHLMTREYQYMLDSHTAYDGTITEDHNLLGPGFAAIIGPLLRNRRVIRNHFTNFRTNSNASRSGFAGNFGRYKQEFGQTTAGWRSVGVTSLPDAAQTSALTNAGTPNDGIPSASSFEYETRPYLMRRNGTNTETPSGFTFAQAGYPASPEITASTYTYGTGAVRLNCKYAVIKAGIDYTANIRSNRLLFG